MSFCKMVAIIENNLVKLKDACRKYHVRSLHLVGCAISESTFSQDSDIELVYNFNKKEIPEMEYADNYFDFLFLLRDIFQRTVHFIPEEKLKNPYLLERINQ